MALRSPTKPSTAAYPRDPWSAEVQADFANLRSEIARLTQRHREALEALEDVCEQRDEARRERGRAIAGWEEESRLCGEAIKQRDYWMKLARAEAERADQMQPLSKGERCLWRLVAAALLVGWGVVIGARL